MLGNFLHRSDSDKSSETSAPSPIIPGPKRPPVSPEPEDPTFLQQPIEGLNNSDDFTADGTAMPENLNRPIIPNFSEDEKAPSDTVQTPVLPVPKKISDDDIEGKILPDPEQIKPEATPVPPVFSEVPSEPVIPGATSSEPEEVSEPPVPEPPTDKEPEEAPVPNPPAEEEQPKEEVMPPSQPSEPESASESAPKATETETDTPAEEQPADESAIVDYKSENFLSSLFANETTCLTAPNGTFPVKDETRSVLVLFSNGRFFVAESAKFDGKVLGFEYLARKRRLQIGKPEYVPTIIINDIYEYAAKNTETTFVPQVVEMSAQEEVRMQRDFVTIISRAAANKVSDIHIVVADHTTIMFRVNGLMQTEMEYNREWGESFVRSAFASADISDANYAQNEYQAAQKLGRTPLRGSGGKLLLPRNVLGIRLQFNPIAFGTRYVVMRLLYAEDDMTAASNLEALGFTKEQSKIFYEMRAIPTGMIVISGPTGSGKSTTLQRNMIAMLQERNYEINLITVEDPPEYPIPGARQMPVTNAMVEETKEREFTKALSAALRSDPDALMIGEIRTLSAADLAFRGALSGHNVWTTLHANSAPAILMRLKDMGIEDFKLQDPSLMKGLMAQRLFRKVCPCCRLKATDHLTHPAVERLRLAFGDAALEKCYLRGPGCDECDHRGVKGRTVVAEFIQPDATFLDLSIKGEFEKAKNYWINDLNGKTLRDTAVLHMLKGDVDIEEVEKWTGFLDQQILA